MADATPRIGDPWQCVPGMRTSRDMDQLVNDVRSIRPDLLADIVATVCQMFDSEITSAVLERWYNLDGVDSVDYSVLTEHVNEEVGKGLAVIFGETIK